ncbi:MAG: hypothetical protein M3Q98_11310, partial [Actinomycetota bacterium]|nr:hypothetical protein [Actinomycetota bacterium]
MSDPNQEPKDAKLLVAAALVGIVLLAGIAMVGVRAFSNDDKSAPTQPRATSTAGTAHSSSTCGLPDGSQSVPTEAPPTKWYFIGPIAAPKSRQIGPGTKTGGLSTCFTRSPAGSLFAAATLIAETFPDDDGAKAAARARMVPNAALEDALAEPSKPNRFPSQIVGYKFVDYTPDRVSLTIASRLTAGPQAGGIGALTMTMVWRQGDWWWELQ